MKLLKGITFIDLFAGIGGFHQVLNAPNFGVLQKRERIYIIAFRQDLLMKNFTIPLFYKKPTKLIDFCLPDTETDEYIINRSDIILKENINLTANILSNYSQKPIIISMINKGGQGERIYHQNGQAITLCAYGVGAKMEIYQINGKIRKLTSRECARIMGFFDSFIISESKNIAYKQFGNSVVVNV